MNPSFGLCVPLQASPESSVAPLLSADFKELVRSRTNIVELIGERFRLEPRRGGREYVCLCPFHDDHRPSMTISPERQTYKCWVCLEGGDCFSWWMRIEGVEFFEALRALADRAGLEMPKFSPAEEGGQRSLRARLLEIAAWAEKEFHHALKTLPEGRRARDYLESRGFRRETIERFRLGYHPPDWDWLIQKAQGRYSIDELLAARLIKERVGGNGYYDEFRDRVLFPIRDTAGRPVAFGGRILPDADWADAPKYINSADGTLYSKSQLLYGFDLARDAIRTSKTAIVVEGYTDCVLPQQHGIGNIVATLGTALTDEQVTLLRRLAARIILVYDGDAAGQRATERVLPRVLSQKVDLQILTLPGGADPADFLAEHGAEAFQQLLAESVEAWEYKLRLTVAKFGLETIDGQDRVLSEMLELLAVSSNIAGSPREDLILGRLAQRLRIPEAKVRARLKELRQQARTSRKIAAPASTPRAAQAPSEHPLRPRTPHKYRQAEQEILEIIFAAPETAAEIRQHIAVGEFEDPQLQQLLQLCYDVVEQGDDPTFDRILSELECPEMKRLAADIDEQSRRKGIVDKLRVDDAPAVTATPSPRFLDQAVSIFARRRQERSHELLQGRTAQQPARHGALDEEARARLERAMEFHRQRATQKTLN